MLQVPQIGVKRKEPEELKGGLDARELVAWFRSKKDLYDYLALQSKFPQTHSHFPVGQYFMPARKKVTKDFL